MANPKYTDLPGIAFDQPDVYETSDLPESEQILGDRVDDSESVEKLTISTSDAYEKFKGKNIDSSNADFSDRIISARKTGYDIQSGEYEMLGCKEHEKETLEQKYQRLKHEFGELVEEINHIKSDAKSESSDSKSAAALSRDVELLQKELVNLNLQKVLGTELMANIADPNGSLQKKLITQLESFKASKDSPSGKSKSTDASGADDNCIKYELFYKPELSKHHQTTKAAELEQRLQKLESVIGKDTSKLGAIVGEMEHKSIVSAVRTLAAKLTLLDPTQLDIIENRLQGVSQKLAQINEKKSTIDNAEKQSQVTQLYNLMKENEAALHTLPDIVERMVCLEELHKQALQFSQALNELDNVQQQSVMSLKNNEKMLKVMEESFEKNMEMIKSNVASLENRLSALKK